MTILLTFYPASFPWFPYQRVTARDKLLYFSKFVHSRNWLSLHTRRKCHWLLLAVMSWLRWMAKRSEDASIHGVLQKVSSLSYHKGRPKSHCCVHFFWWRTVKSTCILCIWSELTCHLLVFFILRTAFGNQGDDWDAKTIFFILTSIADI